MGTVTETAILRKSKETNELLAKILKELQDNNRWMAHLTGLLKRD